MKLLAVAAATASLIVAASLGASASAQSHSNSSSNIHGLSILIHVPTRHGLETRRAFLPLQTGPTATATSAAQPSETAISTAEPTATATAVPTTSPFPDPVALLNQAIGLFERITGVHFEDIIIGDQTNVEHLSIDGKGVANCTSEMATVTAVDSVPGTAQKKTQHYEFIEKGKKFYKRQLVNDKTRHKWTKSTQNGVNAFSTKSDPGFSIDNPLACPTAATGGSGGSADQLKDVENQGSVTYHNQLTWHVTAIDVSTDAQGNTSETPLDFYIGQSQALIYGFKETFNDPADSITLTFEQVLSQFGKKVSVPTPKIGATKP